MTCNRVLILHQGRMIADDTPRNLEKLMSGGGQIVAEIAAPIGLLSDCWENTPEIEHFDLAPTDGEYIRCSLSARAGHDLRPQIFSLVCQRGWKLRELTHSRHSLEDIFVSVTRPDREEET
jgi:ABC-2 type transport system ATP-binding protein